MTTFNGTMAKLRSKAEKTIESLYLKWILSKPWPFVSKFSVFPKVLKKIEKEKFFSKSALAHPIFTLDGGFQLFLVACNITLTLVALKVVIKLGKIDFLQFNVKNRQVIRKCSYVINFLKRPRINSFQSHGNF